MSQARIIIYDPRGTFGSLECLSGCGRTLQPVTAAEGLLGGLAETGARRMPVALVLDGDPGSGMEPALLARIAAVPSQVPLATIVAVSDRMRGRAWIDAGASSFLVRPFDRDDLRLDVDRWLRFSDILRRSIDREEALRRFFAMYAHDLKNPLSAVAGYCELALGHPDLPPDLRADLTKVNRNIDLLNAMAAGLQDMVRGPDALRLTPREVRLGDVVNGAADMLRLRASSRRVEIRVRIDETTGPVRLDPSRLLEALANVLDNAIKFSPDGAAIEVAALAGPDIVEIRVDDEGPGIAPEDREGIFERFTPAAARSPLGNLGLGLSIAREIVELHGGTIRAEPRHPRGTRMAIRIPRSGAGEGAGEDGTITSGPVGETVIFGENRR